jgi:hypothetical protein
VNGGFAEYCAYPQGKVFHVRTLSYVNATLLEPASRATHGLEKIAPKVLAISVSDILMLGWFQGPYDWSWSGWPHIGSIAKIERR